MVASTLVDTNVLVAASSPRRALHEAAWAVLEGENPLVTTPQVIREFLVVSTRPVAGNGLGQPAAEAVANAETYLERMRLLPEDGPVSARLRSLVADGFATGVPIHDANLVASALVHRVPRILTGDARHFDRFADLIEIVLLE